MLGIVGLAVDSMTHGPFIVGMHDVKSVYMVIHG